MHQLWQMWIGGIAPSELKTIQDYCNTLTLSTASIGNNPKVNEEYRSSQVGWVSRTEEAAKPARDIIWRYIADANRNAFGFNIDYLADMQYTVYNGTTKDKYDWHIDTFWANPTAYDRKLSFVLQLSDPEEYRGGDFLFDPEVPQPNPVDLKKQGTIIVFPSFLRHRVVPVEYGIRKSLVAWAEGPKFR